VFTDALASALAVQEVNAAMGVIVAAPTAGGAGVLPGVLLGIAKHRQTSDAEMIRALARPITLRRQNNRAPRLAVISFPAIGRATCCYRAYNLTLRSGYPPRHRGPGPESCR